ncbi:unnamed protein product (macronuclear) [Paramecium tetraurelia]|uniref:RING-CH-type domain-containing protein n=1 Tax=Paramecium tetraurelia TaxID=5888 RepID=A0C6L5_PARTE|nr:uncharacterized protein GSPATT00035561001 [Paramecium tetraurelia]CAK66432.1 unnamed protein product [Paramecium tetraurelia]|eukprot:XP_001433829.1 hypothetical protein (macronuclear) [Paramecium tetraurelia strain d4-2]
MQNQQYSDKSYYSKQKKYYRCMNKSDFGIVTSSSPQKFNRLNQSQQLIPQEYLTNGIQGFNTSPRKEKYKKQIKNTHFLKVNILLNVQSQDNERKKTVWCNIYQYQMNATELEMSKKGRICRICMMEEETSRFIYPCKCKGSTQFVHEECFKSWILTKNNVEKVLKKDISCEVCSQKINMKLIIQDKVQFSLFKDIPKHQKVCWLIIFFLILLQITGASILAVLVGFQNFGIVAVITLLAGFSVALFFYLIAQVINSLSVEIIDQWIFSNYRGDKGPIMVDMQSQYLQSQQKLHCSPKSPKQRRKSCVPQFGGLQVIQFEQYPSEI